MKLKLTKMGNSVGMVLPKEIRDKMKLTSGDAVYLTETPEGYNITPYDPEFSQQMDVARKVMKKRRAVLRELAK
ncbi:transcriptional regulator [Candidatus Nitromaritima sp. SCGC AAA799-A02]|nr:transcriptional regulator [Candidatus Nitromaritima sp. SCGC AAA799-A02]